MRGMDTNALASSIVLVCRPRPADAATVSRRAFLRELNDVLPEALDEMTKGSGDERSPVAPVDLSQAIIGPGMAVFSKYAAVLEADGTPMSVRTALQLINRFLAEDDFDPDTQFCLHWFEQHGWKDGKFGDADTLARAKGTSVDGVKQAGVLASRRRHRPPAEVGRVSRPTGTRRPTPACPSGKPCTSSSASSRRTARPAPARCSPRSRARPKPPASSPTASTRSANARAGPRTPAPTTNSSRAGAASNPPPLRRRRRKQTTLFG